jgi:hypothetical protein
MAKTYPTIGPFTAGDILTAATMTDVQTNLANQRVPPMCMATRSGTQSTLNATFTAVQFNGTDRYDTDSMHDPASNNTRITFNTAGVYVVQGEMYWDANATGVRLARIRLNGATTLNTAIVPNTGGSDGVATLVGCTYDFVVSDYIELLGYQSSGGALNMQASCFLSAAWVGQVS